MRVNYTFFDIIRALFVKESKHKYREECKRIFSTIYGGKNVCLTPSGRDAIYEILIRLPQSVVIVPAYTCMAVVEAVKLAGKEIVFCETNSETYNSDFIENITPNSIVLATHQYGIPCNITEIAIRCKAVGAILIEDCATSLGTTVNGKMTGVYGDFAIISFNASKLLNVPPVGGVLIGKNKEIIDIIEDNEEWKDGGMSFKIKALLKGLVFVLTKNSFLYKCFHYIAIESKGRLQKTKHDKPSEKKTDLYKYRFTEWQAKILLKQLRNLSWMMDKRKQLYSIYNDSIINPLIKKPIVDGNAVCCRYTIQVQVNKRTDFYQKSVKSGVDMDFSHCSLGCPSTFKKEYLMANQILNIPFYTYLSNREIKKIIRVVNSIR